MSSASRITALIVAAAACVFRAAAEPPARPTREQIAQWVVELGDDDFNVREKASQKLYEAGPASEDALQEAAHSEDPEVVRRANEILGKFRWGLYADAPKDVVDLINRYRAADRNGKTKVIDELLRAGSSGYRTLCKIAGAEDDPAVRGEVYRRLAREVNGLAPQLLLDENYDTLELLLDAVLANDPDAGIEDYAAYWMMRGKLDERIAHFKALAARGADAEKNGEFVAHLLHAKGDLAAAREAADKAGKPELADALLFEAGDWKALAARPVHSPSNVSYETLGLRATYHRLAGDAPGFDDAVAELRKDAAAYPGDEFRRFHLAKVLLLNDRPAEGLDAILDAPNHHAVAFELLAAQMRYTEALKLADDALKAGTPDAPVLEILQARTLYSLGEKDRATAIFTRYGGQIATAGQVSWPETLIDAEMRVGLKDQASEHAVKLLSGPHDEKTGERLFLKLFPKNAETAETLWTLLRVHDKLSPAAALKQTRGLLDGKVEPKVVAALAKGDALSNVIVPAPGGQQDLVSLSPPKLFAAVAEAALACKDETLARSLLEKADSPEALIRLGDLNADKNEWDKAAEHYRQAWEKDHSQVLALYLDGWALTQAGQEKEGQRRMEVAHWAPLGDGEARSVFLKGLEEHGRSAAVRRERELLLRLSPAGSKDAAQGIREMSADALERKDDTAAAAGQERTMLRCLYRDVNYLQPAAYLGVPAFVHRLRAKIATAAGRFDEARDEVNLGLTALPGDTFFPIELVPAWEKAGLKKEAQELFDRCIAVQEKLCQDYPDCPWGHNSVAWVSACCRRNLESAQEHALKAVALAPDDAGDLDTLGEVRFQRRDGDGAVAAEKKAIELDPKKAYYRKQLKRIEAGDPAAERPSEEDGE